MEDLLIYLQTEGTCKCGLECPFKPDQVFSFDPKVQSRFGLLPNGIDQNRQINCVVCKKFEELFPQTLKPKPTRGRKPGGMIFGNSTLIITDIILQMKNFNILLVNKFLV